MVSRTLTVRQFANFTKKFPSQMERAGIRVNELLAASYQRRIRRRATGRLKNISVVPQGKEKILVQYPNIEIRKIAGYVNAGVVPQHKIPIQLMEASRSGKSTAGRKARSVLGTLQRPIFVQPKPSRAKGFITKSTETLVRDTPKIIEEEIQRTFNAM